MRLRLEYPFLSSVQVGTMYVEKSFLSRWISFLSHDAVLGLMLLRWEENPPECTLHRSLECSLERVSN